MISRNKPAGPSKESGFTLLEMTVVIAIMGIALILITNHGPPIGHFLEQRAVAQQIAQIMRAARGRAIAQGQPVVFTMPQEPSWLTISVQSPPGGIVFAPDGSASGGRVLLEANGHRTAITTDWLTGRVQIDAN